MADRASQLQITEDIGFQKREWAAQRIGWVLLVGLVALAAAGLFGHGPISWTTTTSQDGALSASFERFGRRGGTQALVVRADASTATDGEWQLTMGGDYASAAQFTRISPPPDRSGRVTDGIRYTFTQAQPDADLEVTFSITPDSLWGTSGDLALAGREVTIEQFFFP